MGYFMNLEPGNRQLSPGKTQEDVLKKEILQLQRELEAQKAIRAALEKALNCQPLFDDPAYKSLSKPAENLIKEVALLEMEVLCLEKYLKSLDINSSVKKMSDLAARAINSETEENKEDSVHTRSIPPKDLLPPAIHVTADTICISRSYSTRSQNSACSFRASPSFEAPDPYHSLPLSMFERVHNSTWSAGRRDFPQDETPNWISEEMIKCISVICCHLSDRPFPQHKPFGVNGYKEPWGSFFPMVEIRGLNTAPQMFKSINQLLYHYRSLITRLARVDPRKLKHEEKLAFWINVHNSLVMHAFLIYEIPRGNLKRISLVLKAGYIVGGVTVNVETIQCSILRCRTARPAQWLNLSIFQKANFITGGPIKSYAIKYAEPRLRFALSSGCQSDPPVRLYTRKKVLKELEMAKEEYIQMNIKLHKENRILVPKNIECFVKDSELYSPSSMADEIFLALSCSWRKKVTDKGKLWKKIDWIPHDFSFCVLLSNELVSK